MEEEVEEVTVRCTKKVESFACAREECRGGCIEGVEEPESSQS